MKYNALVFDSRSASILARSQYISSEWLKNFLCSKEIGVSRRTVDKTAFVLSEKAGKSSPLAVVKLSDDEIFGAISEENRMEVLQRILRGALSVFEPTVSIPANWKPYHAGNFVSYMAANIHSGEKSRICMEINCQDSKHCYFFTLTKEQGVSLGELKPDHQFFDRVRRNYGEALRKAGEFEEEFDADESEFSVAVDAR